MRTERGVLQGLIRQLKAQGFELVAANDGGEMFKNPTETAALEAVFSVDESWLYFQKAGYKRHMVYVVLGNDPEEVVNDWSFAEGDPDGFDRAMDDWMSSTLN